mmetsp:Transcript_14013/g.35091  ORF Transcript_14013/g.35091 Transcript_14013/m.35091 type:complete len:216 (+) Transcript_14013:695-1342(+)
MQKAQSHVEANAQRNAVRKLHAIVVAGKRSLASFDEDVANLRLPEVVDHLRAAGKFVVLHALVRLRHRGVQPAEDPAAVEGIRREAEVRLRCGAPNVLCKRHGRNLRLREIAAPLLTHVPDGKLQRVPQLVAPVPVRNDAIHVEVDVASLRGVVGQPKAKRVRAALRDATREVLRLSLLRLFHLLRVEVATHQRLVQTLQRNALNHVQRINDVAE